MATKYDPALVEALGGKVDALAEGRAGEDVVMVGTKDSVAVRRDDGWHVYGWHEVERGSWRGESNTFRLFQMGGGRFDVHLDEPGRMPELIKERMQASTVATFHYDLPRGVLRIVIRRRLDGSDEMDFYAVPSGGASLDDPKTRELAITETDRIKREYGVD